MNKIDGIKCQDNYKIIFVIGHVYRRMLDLLLDPLERGCWYE